MSTELLDSNDSQDLGWVIGRRYRIWTGDVDLVLGYSQGWVVVQDVKTGQVRSHLTRKDHTDREVH